MNSRRLASVRLLLVATLITLASSSANFFGSLKTGWSLPMALPAMLFAALLLPRAVEPARLSRVVIASSAAGFMTAGGNLAALPALVHRGAEAPPVWGQVAWLVAVALFGMAIAVPMLEAILSNSDNVFPTARAATTFLVADDTQERARLFSRLRAFALLSALSTPLRVVLRIPSVLHLGASAFGLDLSPMVLGTGGLIPARVAWSGALSSVIVHLLLVPWLVRRAVLPNATFLEVSAFMAWPATTTMVAAFVTQALLSRKNPPRTRVKARFSARTIVPLFGSALLVFVLGVFVLRLGWLSLVFALFLSVPLAWLSAGSFGATDVIPTRALGPTTQFALGALPRTDFANVCMGTNVACGSAFGAAVTLSHARLAANVPNVSRWRVAHVGGVLVGAIAVCTLYWMVFTKGGAQLGSSEWAAPSVLLWERISSDVSGGVTNLRGAQKVAAAIGFVAGVLGTWIERRTRAGYAPSFVAMAAALVVPCSTSLTIALGAALATLAAKRTASPLAATASAAGLVAGDTVAMAIAAILGQR